MLATTRSSRALALAVRSQRPRSITAQQQFYSSSSRASSSASSSSSRATLIGGSAVVAAIAISSYSLSPLYNDAPSPNLSGGPNPVGDIVTPTDASQQDQMRDRAQRLGVYAWGSNRYNVVAPDSPTTTLVKSPRSIPFFAGMALRDVVLEEKHGVAVDAHGDVLQWGLGFFDPTSRAVSVDVEEAPLGRRREKERANELTPRGSEAAKPRDPVKTLVGKDIVRVVANDTKVYALSRKGQVFVFSASQSEQQEQKKKAPWSANPLALFGIFRGLEIDHERVGLPKTITLAKGDKIAQLDSGTSHVVALTQQGRALTLPIDDKANYFGQLGCRKVLLNPPTGSAKSDPLETVFEPSILDKPDEPMGPVIKGNLPYGLPPPPEAAKPKPKKSKTKVPDQLAPFVDQRVNEPASLTATELPSSIRYCTTFSDIPALRQVVITEVAVGNEHNLARTPDGKVLAWGRHTHGQLGVGSNFSIECIPTPTEVVLARCFANSSRDVKCTGVAAGGDNSFFVTERREEGRMGVGKSIDVLASGKGQWGTLGNAMWSQVKPDPTRVKTVSGLMEYSERTNTTHPVPIHSINVGRPGHVALVLDTVESESHAAFGRDVMVFGHNAAYQLGTGKRSNLSVPQHLHPLPPPTLVMGGAIPESLTSQQSERSKLAEADLNSGALTHMPHNRLQLASETKSNTHGAPTSTGSTDGKKKKGVTVEERISAGTVSMAVWWKCDV